jgi:hypothetical protein
VPGLQGLREARPPAAGALAARSLEGRGYGPLSMSPQLTDDVPARRMRLDLLPLEASLYDLVRNFLPAHAQTAAARTFSA